MANLKTWLEEAEKIHGETIEAMVVGQHYRARWDDAVQHDENVLLSRDAGLARVDQEYSNGYGGADCFPLYAWTESRVYFVAEYDGATGLNWVPRHPVQIEPSFSGQDGEDE